MSGRIRNRYFLLVDIAILPLAAYLSFVLRLEDMTVDKYQTDCAILAVLSLVIIPAVFYLAGIYRRFWAFASLDEMLLISGAVLIGVGVASVLTWIASWRLALLPPPRSIPIMFLFLALTGTAAPRLARRVLSYRRHWHSHDDSFSHVLIMGAGEAGAMTAQELRRNPQLGLEVVGFVDDDEAKHGMSIHGVPVLGKRDDIPTLVLQHDVRQVIIAMPAAPGPAIREVLKICEMSRVQTQIIPGIYELVNGAASVSHLRKVEIEDLLRRTPVQTDVTAVNGLLNGQRVLITGGGGSIGSELCRQVLRCGPAQLVVLGHGENSVFEIQNELKRLQATIGDQAAGNCRINAVIADIRMPERLQAVFDEVHPQIVFHAAAHKHVPLMELNPAEAIVNNVLGTRTVLQACVRTGVERFVLISTDKAVNPSSIMGCSKRVAELLVLKAARATGKPYVAVRFGNVLGSRGSVVLTFRQQIAAGGPVTVTHPDMQRYFMTIPEAVQLVLQAAVLGHGGEVFTLDMGEPVKLLDLARDMIRLSGLEVGRDIEIAFCGIRPGEKLSEELYLSCEDYRRTSHDKIFIASNASSIVPADLDTEVDALGMAARRDDRTAISSILCRLVPEYNPVQPGPSSPTPLTQTAQMALRSGDQPARPAVIHGSD